MKNVLPLVHEDVGQEVRLQATLDPDPNFGWAPWLNRNSCP